MRSTPATERISVANMSEQRCSRERARGEVGGGRGEREVKCNPDMIALRSAYLLSVKFQTATIELS